MTNVLFLDLETQKTAEDVGGWEHAADMLVAVVVTFNTANERFHVYEETDIPLLFDELAESDLVVGYNIKKFDYSVLSKYVPSNFSFPATLDMMESVGRVVGHPVKLDNLAKTTLGESKTASGLEAVRLFRDGLMHDLVEYCVQDVLITRDLYFHGLKHGVVSLTERDGTRRQVKVDWGRNE